MRHIVEQIKGIIESLKKDRLGNINLINFLENNHITGIERIGNALLVRGTSDRNWVYIGCSSDSELAAIKVLLNEQDKCFAAIEDWMVPVLLKDEAVLWNMSLTQFYLPDDVDLPEPVHQTKTLNLVSKLGFIKHRNCHWFQIK
jgi:8-oxo-dGTP diphosphatase